MKITILKNASTKKPAGYCECYVDEPPMMNKK
jgi:hypothetical protein